jgi:hypothetical protein
VDLALARIQKSLFVQNHSALLVGCFLSQVHDSAWSSSTLHLEVMMLAAAPKSEFFALC